MSHADNELNNSESSNSESSNSESNDSGESSNSGSNSGESSNHELSHTLEKEELTPELSECYALFRLSEDTSLQEAHRAFYAKKEAVVKAGRQRTKQDVALLQQAWQKVATHIQEKNQKRVNRPLQPSTFFINNRTAQLVTVVIILRYFGGDYLLKWMLSWILYIGSWILCVATICIHELGHGIAALISGYAAVPTPIGLTLISDQRSILVYATGLYWLWRLYTAGKKKQSRWQTSLAISLAVVQVLATWIISDEAADAFITFGGSGGDLIISAVVTLGLFWQHPTSRKWLYLRYYVVAGAWYTLLATSWQWHEIKYNGQDLPWGSLLGGADDSNGDMNLLHYVHGFSIEQMTNLYYFLSNACLILAMGAYAYIFLLKRRERGKVKKEPSC